MMIRLTTNESSVLSCFLLAYLLCPAMPSSIPKPFISTSLTCYTYKKVNGRTTMRYNDDCIFGNTCCYSAEFADPKTGEIIESGGCEDEYRHLISTHPVFGPIMLLTATYMCEEGTCLEQVTNRGTARLCACIENNCNINGIDNIMRFFHERNRKGLVKSPPDYGSILEKTVQILVDG